MYQRNNPSHATSEARNLLGVCIIGTVCNLPNHNHEVSADAVQISPTLTYQHGSQPVTTKRANDGQTYRIFGTINYWPATGQMHIVQRDGALPSEIGALFATAEHAKQDPASWPVHPCHDDRRRIALCRPVDEHYLAEAAAIIFDDLERTEQDNVLTSWAEDLTNA